MKKIKLLIISNRKLCKNENLEKQLEKIFVDYKEKTKFKEFQIEGVILREKDLAEATKSFLAQKRNNFEIKIDKLTVLNPINTLKRGYTVTQIKDKRIDNLEEIEVNDEMITILKNGKLISVVKEKIYEKNND